MHEKILSVDQVNGTVEVGIFLEPIAAYFPDQGLFGGQILGLEQKMGKKQQQSGDGVLHGD
jgi:hypothetical protein